MGVDKKDIKTVVHLETSATAEAYIQEAGRGGRDGSIAKAILIWSLEDSLNFSVFADNSREAALRHFAETNDCRRQVLLDALGGEQAVCSGCDLCNERKLKEENPAAYGKIKKPLSDYETALKIIRRNPNYYNREELQSYLYGAFNKISRSWAGKNIWTNSDCVDVIKQLEDKGEIEESGFLWKGKLRIRKKSS